MKTLTKEQLIQRGEDLDDFILVNVLPQDTFLKKHIPHSINIPHQDTNFTSLVEKAAGTKNRKIVVYCASFDCDASSNAAETLENAGFSNIYDYEGGTKDWFASSESKAA